MPRGLHSGVPSYRQFDHGCNSNDDAKKTPFVQTHTGQLGSCVDLSRMAFLGFDLRAALSAAMTAMQCKCDNSRACEQGESAWLWNVGIAQGWREATGHRAIQQKIIIVARREG